ncbi:metalloregulator ArsR/SmtB family transcription factor [Asticcacaulis sp. AC460]|uniref:metalloregulator ArsR/SmtB family transcription factor n=1 Tax=Asticcacaulis sp. AC460 TaxID=1282360 RepID=UPI00041899E6|nr:metalloregulator ArsR/SmtB family transcription factor [Asticcacaulis sp. AC460]
MIGKAAASPKRLELIELLCQAPMTVEALAREAQISVKLASAHLKDLKSARLVDTERQGKYVIYRLASEDVARFWVTTRMLAEARLTELKDALERFAGASDEWEGASRNDLLERAAAGDIIVIDVRPELEFQVAHLPFARSLPLAEIEERLNELPRDRPIVAYCRGPFCLMAKDAVNMLRARGFDAVKLRDGVAEWAAP